VWLTLRRQSCLPDASIVSGPVARWIRHRPTEPGIAGLSPARVILLVAIVGRHAAPSRLHQSLHHGRQLSWLHATQTRDARLKELRVRSARPAPAATMFTVRSEVAAQPGDQWLQSVCRPWRLALGVLRHTRYKSKTFVGRNQSGRNAFILTVRAQCKHPNTCTVGAKFPYDHSLRDSNPQSSD
jgi:hypothetical protein